MMGRLVTIRRITIAAFALTGSSDGGSLPLDARGNGSNSCAGRVVDLALHVIIQ